MVSDFLSVNVTCTFATGAPVFGCSVSFGSVLQFNITRRTQFNVVADNVIIMEGELDKSQLDMVIVAEILADGEVSPVSPQPLITTIIAPTTTTGNLVPILCVRVCIRIHIAQ